MLKIEDLHLSFGGIKALQGVNFEAKAGEITGVIGPNGAGKTSLFNAISGFYKPDRGRVSFDAEDITDLSPDKRAGLGLARTFQNIALFRGMTVLDNIKLGGHTRLNTSVWQALRYFGAAQKAELELRREIEEQVIDFLEIDHIRKYPITMLPYGLQKRVELGRALAMRPRVLLLDEPVAGMNREEKEDMARFILDIREEWGVTVLMVEHDMGMVMDISDHIAVLNFGQVITEGLPADVQNNPEVIKAYLGNSDIESLRKKLNAEGEAA